MSIELKAQLLYPDPMKPSGLTYELPEDAKVTIEIFNESGKCLRTILNQTPMKAGPQLLEFNTIGLREGDYTLRIIALIRGVEYRMAKKITIEGSTEC